MKKLFTLAVSTLMILSMSACKTKPADDPNLVSSPSPKESSDPVAIENGLSENGYWIFAVLSDVEMLEKTLSVDGVFHDKGDENQRVYRKLALYAQDENYNITDRYTLSVPELIVNSPNFRIEGGTVAGNVIVQAEGFELEDATIEGDLIFATQEIKNEAVLSGTVKGEILLADATADENATENLETEELTDENIASEAAETEAVELTTVK